VKQRRGTEKLVVALALIALVLFTVPRETEGALELNALGVVTRASFLLPVQGSANAPGFTVGNEVANGLSTTTFSTPCGKVRVNLPDDMAAGDTISATVIAEPDGKDPKEQTKNLGELNGYVVEVEKQQTSATRSLFKLAVPPTTGTTTNIVLKDKNGKEVARSGVPVTPRQPPRSEYELPTLGQQGRAVTVPGPFDGDFGTTNVNVGGEDLEILAESPRKVVARNTSKQVGPSRLEVRERDKTTTGEFRTLALKLSAPKLELLRGEQTTLTVAVTGLEGLKEPVPLELENKSASIIQLGGGEFQRTKIIPSQVQGGTYTTERPLTGVQRGAFTIVGTVIGRRSKSPSARCRESQTQRLENCKTQQCREEAQQKLADCNQLSDDQFGFFCNGVVPLKQCSVASPCKLTTDQDGDGKLDVCVNGSQCAPASEGNICDVRNAYNCYLKTTFYPQGPLYPLATCECNCQ
jgi:hypothetical protein